MPGKIAEALRLHSSPVAVLLTDDRPPVATQFKEGHWGCAGNMLVAASKGRTAVFSRQTFGCAGGGTGLGFGNQYENFPIDYFLSTGTAQLGETEERAVRLEGEHYCKNPEIAREFVKKLPMRDVPTKYVVFKPLEKVIEEEVPTLVILLVNPDQLSALVVLANYARKSNESVIAPFGAGCHSIIFGYAEAEKEEPRAVIGFFDITARKHVEKDILSFTMPYKMYLEMEANVEGSFLEKDQWLKIAERI